MALFKNQMKWNKGQNRGMEIQVAECCASPHQCFLSECKPGMETHQKQKRPESVQIYISINR